MTETNPANVVAVIDIGSSAIRMIIAEVSRESRIRYLENLQKEVALGKDVFTRGRIGSARMREAISILRGYKSVMDEYGVKNSHAIATSAVWEATNRDTFVDRVFLRTGIDVEVIDGAEENRLELIAVEHALGESFDFDRQSFFIIEVGSGSTVVIILDEGQVQVTRTLPLGAVRLAGYDIVGEHPKKTRKLLKRNIHDIARYAGKEYSLGEVETFIGLGSDMRMLSAQVAPEAREHFVELKRDDFTHLVEEATHLSQEEVAERYGLSYERAETFRVALLINLFFLRETKATQVIVPMVSIRDGLLLEQAQVVSGQHGTDVSRLVISSAKRLGRKYDYDEANALWVADAAVQLFDELRVAAILHDIGAYVSPDGRHRHSSYLIRASELFGLRKSDKEIVANVARYHRGSLPRPTHEPFMSLPKQTRAAVSKLSAILRVAIALDKSRQQKIPGFRLDRSGEPYVIRLPEHSPDVSLERDSLARKGSMFSEVFGVPIVLRIENGAEAET